MRNNSYGQNVFLNCPFDERYSPFFRAAVFTIIDCGFTVRCGLELSDASQVRIQKILDQIAECKLGIHDLSRTQLDERSQLPRFNMPLEFGIFLGAKFLGDSDQRQKMCLVFDEEPYRYQKYLSDIAGQDINTHQNNPRVMVSRIRDWLAAFSINKIPSGSVIWERYLIFQNELKGLCKAVKHKPEELTYFDYINHVKKFVRVKSDILKTGLKMRWGKKLQEPSLPHIREAIEGFKDDSDSFAILAKSKLTYMQTVGSESEGYSLEYQEGSIDEHYECTNDLSREDVIEALQAYRTGDESWRTRFRWERENFS